MRDDQEFNIKFVTLHSIKKFTFLVVQVQIFFIDVKYSNFLNFSAREDGPNGVSFF